MGRVTVFAILTALASFCQNALHAEVPFRIQVIDEATDRGVPLVELQTTNNMRFYTDSQGVVAINEPELWGLDSYFHIKSHGYEFPKDGFGNRGSRLKIESGSSATLKIKRINIAERLYRLTGSGIYRDSKLVGMPLPIKEPLLNGQVFGCDATVSAVYHNKLNWFWGDTNRPQYPLGNFHVTGATSRLPSDGGLDPALGVDFEFFKGIDGFVRPMTTMPGDEAAWINGLIVIPMESSGDSKEKTRGERMFAGYVRVKPGFVIDRYGMAEFDDRISGFQSIADFGREPVCKPMGHPIRLTDNGTDYVYYGTTIPLIRVPARAESIARKEAYEAYTCLREGSPLDHPVIDRDADGTVRYSWKRNTPPVEPQDQSKLVELDESNTRRLKSHEGLFQFRDRDTGKPVIAHYGSCYWNAYCNRFVLIFAEYNGDTSMLGEIWYSEGDTPLGPWAYAVKIVTHDRYSFYNPKQHPDFAQQGGRLIYFDGTYTHDFSGNPDQTPRYDYNPIMYRLDLDDARLGLPVAFYRSTDEQSASFSTRTGVTPNEAVTPQGRLSIAFFAFDRPHESMIPVYSESKKTGKLSLKPIFEQARKTIAFYAFPADFKHPSRMVVPLYEYVSENGHRHYSTNSRWALAGFRRTDEPLSQVWKNPYLED